MTFTNPSNGPYQNAKGELVVGTGAGTQPGLLAVGSNNQVLTADSSQTTGVKWAASASGGGLILIQSITASNSANITFSSGLIYVDYLLVVSGAIPVSAGSFYMQLSTDGGSTWISTGYAGLGAALTSVSSLTNNVSSSNGFVLSISCATSSAGGLTGMYEISLSPSGAASGVSGVHSIYAYNGGTPTWAYGMGGGAGPTGGNALLIVNGGGNIASGTFTLYGFNE